MRAKELDNLRNELLRRRRTILALLGEAQRKQVAMIDAALSRIAGGEYGICVDCGTDIDPKRLQALPFALLCTDCATRRERGTVAEVEGPTF